MHPTPASCSPRSPESLFQPTCSLGSSAGTGGNPLALVELANALPTRQLSGQDPLPLQLPLTEGVERAFLDRVRRLPSGAQLFLLVAAADDSGRAAIVRQAALALDTSTEEVHAAEDSGLVSVVDGVVTLRHPLVRSAVYGAATGSQRRAAHRALADALIGTGDVDRRAWHRAAAVDEPDESVVADLDQVAERASQRGGLEAASAAWERAAELTLAAGPRASRLLSAAGAAWAGAQPGRARALAEAARAAADSLVVRADVDQLRARIEWNIGSAPVGHRILLQAARDVAGTDFTRATVMARTAATAAAFGADSGIDIDPSDFVGDLDSMPPGGARSSALLLSGFADIARGNLRDASAAFRQAFAEDPASGDVDLPPNLGLAALYIGDDDVALREYGQFVARARDAGAPLTILYGLARRAPAEISTGDWRAAAAGSAEALDLARGIGQDPLGSLPLAWLTLLAALRGDQAEFDRCQTEFDRPTRGRDVALTAVVSRDVMLLGPGRRRGRHTGRGASSPRADHPRDGGQHVGAGPHRGGCTCRSTRSGPASGRTSSRPWPISSVHPGRWHPPLMRTPCSPRGPRRNRCLSAPWKRTHDHRVASTRPGPSWRSESSYVARVVGSTPACTSAPHWTRSRTSAPNGGQNGHDRSCGRRARPLGGGTPALPSTSPPKSGTSPSWYVRA